MSWLTKEHAEWLQRCGVPRGEIEIDNRFRQIELAASLMAYSLLVWALIRWGMWQGVAPGNGHESITSFPEMSTIVLVAVILLLHLLCPRLGGYG